jgi:hypothetical protein
VCHVAHPFHPWIIITGNSPGLWDDQSKCDELDRAFSVHGRDEKWTRHITRNCCIEGIRPKCRVEGKTKIDSKEIM